MINKLKSIIKGISGIMDDILSGMALGMIYENVVICNGGGVIVQALD